MKLIKVLMAALMMVAFSFTSCSDDDDKDSGLAEGKMSATIDGTSKDFSVSQATLTKVTQGNQTYQTLMIVAGGGTSQTNYEVFTVAVHASKIEAKTYTVPVYDEKASYDYVSGLAFGTYTNATQEVYMAFMLKGSSGSVKISSISNTSAKGTYDMVLVSTKDNTKKVTLKGEFNAKVVSSIEVK